jgi:hypothetical protein
MWTILPQIEKRGESEEVVLVKRCFGNLKALIGWTGNTTPNSLPCEINFSQRWVSKIDGTAYQAGVKKVTDPETGKLKEVRTKPNTKFYFLRDKVTVKYVKLTDIVEVKTKSVIKVTQKVPVDKDTSQAFQDESGKWMVKKVISMADFEVSNKDYRPQWNRCLQHIKKEFGLAIARQYGEAIFEKLG